MYNSLSLKTSAILSPHMVMYNNILQMNTTDLLEHISELSHENPFIELQNVSSKDMKIFRSGSRSGANNYGKSSYTNEYWDSERHVKINGNHETIYDHLISQINTLPIAKEYLAIMHFLTYCLDANGFLYEDIEKMSICKQVPKEKLENILQNLQQLEPAGVFARSLKECLLLQLDRLGGDEICETIVKHHLEDLGKKHYHVIAKSLKISDEETRRACAEIVKLNPRPGTAFSANDMPEFVIPDLELVSDRNSWDIVPISQNQHNIKLNDYYIELLYSSEDPKLTAYLKTHFENANKFVQCLEQRKSTLIKVAKYIVVHQVKFFFEKKDELLPLKLSDVAENLGLHESTISRAVRGKYILCNRGVHELNKFFCQTASKNTDASADEVKQKIAKLISEESSKKPLSDQKISDILTKEGMAVARRTVAKYRDSLGIAPATGRK